MADGTVRGAFDLNVEQPLRGLRSIRTEGGRADAMLRQLGGTMDRMGGPVATRKLDDYERRLRKVGTTAESTGAKVSASWETQRRVIEKQSDRIELRVGRLESRIERYGRQRATARVELNGTAKVQAELLALERRLASFGRQRSTATAGIGGGGLGGLASTTAGGGGGGGGLGGAGKIALAGLGLLPGVQGLLGGATALVGSASGAALGGATVAGGALATLGLGGALTAGVAKGAINELKELDKVQQKYSETVRKYGQDSKQAAIGRRELTFAEDHAGPAASLASRQLTLTRNTYRAAFAPGRRAIYGGIGNVAIAARGLAPTVGRAAAIAATASAGAATNYAGFLSGSQTQRTVMGLTREFAHDLPMVERTLENVTSTVEHLAMAARPFFREGAEWVQSWTHTMASNTGNEARVQNTMRGLVNETKDWGKLAGATYRTLRDIFNLGRPSGDSMVVSLTTTLDRWDAWIQRNPQKVRGFFREAETTTSNIASTLVSITHLLSQTATALTPIFNRALPLVRLATSLGPGGTTAASALLYGGYSAFRGGRGGGGVSAGGLLAAGVLGRPVRGAGAGTRMAGGVLAAEGPAIVRTAGGVSPGAYPLIFPGGRVSGLTSSGSRRSPLAGRAAGVVGGAAKTLGLTLAAVAALEAVGKGGGAGTIAQNFASGATLGLIHPVDTSGNVGTGRASRFLSGIPGTLSPNAQQAVIERKLARTLSAGFHENGGVLDPLGGTTVQGARLPRAGTAGFAGAARRVAEGLAEGGAHGRNVGAEGKALLTRLQEIKVAAKEAKKARDEALSFQSEQHGQRLGSELGGSYNIERKHGRTATTAFGDVTGGALASLRSMHESGRKVLAESTLAWAHQLAKANPELRKPAEEVTARIKALYRSMGKDIQVVNGHILTGSQSQWKEIQEAMAGNMEKARERMSKSFTAIQREAVGALTAMGFSPGSAHNLVAGVESGLVKMGDIGKGELSASATKGRQAQAYSMHHARGGHIIGGKGLLDTQSVPGGKAAAGEAWIANRHTLADMSRATIKEYGLTAQQMIQGEHRLHSSPGYARGGLAGVRSGVASVVEGILGRFPGLSITSTTQGRHAGGSLHYQGEAVDLAGASGLMYNAAGWTGSTYGRSLEEGIHNPNLSIKHGANVPASFWGPAVWGEHANHIHVGVLGGGGARGAASGGGAGAGVRRIHLRGRNSGLAGVPGALANAGSAMYAAGLQRKLNSRLARTGGGITPMGGGGSPSANERLGLKMMLAAGWPASEWPALKALWTQESGWNANSVNKSSGAYGIPQALGHGHPFNLGDAGAQIAWGLNYIRGRYGSPGAAEAHERSNNWYQRGGRASWAGWHAAGGHFETNGPTVFGAGERGKERVSITPVGHGGGGHSITVKIDGNVSMRSDADVEKVAREVAARILDELDAHGQAGSDRELIGR